MRNINHLFTAFVFAITIIGIDYTTIMSVQHPNEPCRGGLPSVSENYYKTDKLTNWEIATEGQIFEGLERISILWKKRASNIDGKNEVLALYIDKGETICGSNRIIAFIHSFPTDKESFIVCSHDKTYDIVLGIIAPAWSNVLSGRKICMKNISEVVMTSLKPTIIASMKRNSI